MKTFVYLEHWIEDYENHGTNVVMVNHELQTEFTSFHPDEVEEWENGRLLARYSNYENIWKRFEV